MATIYELTANGVGTIPDSGQGTGITVDLGAVNTAPPNPQGFLSSTTSQVLNGMGALSESGVTYTGLVSRSAGVVSSLNNGSQIASALIAGRTFEAAYVAAAATGSILGGRPRWSTC